MAIPTVHTWTSLEVPSSSTLQSQISDPITFAMNPPACIVARVANQLMPNSTGTYVTFDTEVADNRAMFTASSDTITITESGLYLSTGWVQWDVNSVGIRVLEIHQNGVTITSTSDTPVGSSATHRSVITAPLACAVGDVIKLNTYQSSGTGLNIVARAAVFRQSG